jgi:hypothetical protein
MLGWILRAALENLQNQLSQPTFTANFHSLPYKTWNVVKPGFMTQSFRSVHLNKLKSSNYTDITKPASRTVVVPLGLYSCLLGGCLVTWTVVLGSSSPPRSQLFCKKQFHDTLLGCDPFHSLDWTAIVAVFTI